MLLLLRGVPGVVGAALGISFGLAADQGGHATLDLGIGFAQPSAIEVQLSGTPDIRFSLIALPLGTQTATASIPLSLNIPATGGYGAIPTLDLKIGLTATVGSFLDGIGAPGITFGLSAPPRVVTPSSLGIALGLRPGLTDISGGTLTTAASASINFDLAGGVNVFVSAATTDTVFDITGTGSYVAVINTGPVANITFTALLDSITFKIV